MRPLTIADFDLKMTPMQETTEQVKARLRQFFEIKDWQGIDIILATAVAHYIYGEMLWLRIIGPSRSGKTELLRAISKSEDCAKMGSMTPAALRGGLKTGPKLLQRINGKLVVTKDLAVLLTIRKDSRNEIFGLLRPIKDGELISDFGSDEGHLHQKVKFDWILATTPAFEQNRVLESLLGERFIDLRWKPGNREEMAYRAGLNNPYLEMIRTNLAADVCSLMERAKSTQPSDLTEEQVKVISEFGDKAAILRTPVLRNRYRDLVNFPEPEIGTDLTQGLCRIVQRLGILDCGDYEPYLNRLLWDCMPKIRSEVLRCLVQGEANPGQIAEITNLSRREIDFQLEDLRLLKVIERNNKLCMQLYIP